MPLDPRGVGKGESWLAGPGRGGASTQTAEQDSNPGLGVCPCCPRSSENTDGARLSLRLVTRDVPLPRTWPCRSSHGDEGREGGSTGEAGRKDQAPTREPSPPPREAGGLKVQACSDLPRETVAYLPPQGQAGGTASGANSARETPRPTSPRVLVCPEHWERDGGSRDRWPRLGQARLERD